MADMPTHDKSEPQFLASVILYMEQRAKGYAERGDVIFNGRIMAEELGEWIKRLHSAIPSAVAPPEGDDAEAIVKRHAEWDALNKVLGEYVKEYEYGDDGYLPTRQERLLIHDCIQGLLVEDRFMKALARVYPIRSQFNAIASASEPSVPKGMLLVDEILFQTIIKQLTPEQDRAISHAEGLRMHGAAEGAAKSG